MNSKTPLILSMVILITSSFPSREAYSQEVQGGPSLAVRMGFIGEGSGDGTYSTRALSISVGAGKPGFKGMVFGNDNSVATVVGSSGTELVGPNGQIAQDQAFESNICAPTPDGPCPVSGGAFE